MAILVTGSAGFIGNHVALTLLQKGERVIGVDHLNDYYNPALKEARLARLTRHPNYSHLRLDIADAEAMRLEAITNWHDVKHIFHLAAQPGVRYAAVNPYVYIQRNVMAQTVMLEIAQRLPKLQRFVYASSSSVYGANEKVPFAETDAVDHPVSLYAATKRSCELIAQTYHHIHGIDMVGLRFFTVYGPWGRPDMAVWQFTDSILSGKPITLYDGGTLERDFTFIDDIAAGTLATLTLYGPAKHRLYNLGNHTPEKVTTLVKLIEDATGKKAIVEDAPRRADEVARTFADISNAVRELDFAPRISLAEGVGKFVDWYREWKA